jgi:transketolase
MENVASWHHGVPSETELAAELDSPSLTAAEAKIEREGQSMSAPAPSMFSPEARAVAAQTRLEARAAQTSRNSPTRCRRSPPPTATSSLSPRTRAAPASSAPFGQRRFPRQIIEVGIAEQNLVGITAGLSACGKKAFGVSPSCFLTARSLEQIKNDLCYSDVPGVLVGISAGVSYGALGSTHHSLHDFAVMRAITTSRSSSRPTTPRPAKPCALPRRHSPGFPPFRQGCHVYTSLPPAQRSKLGRAVTLREGATSPSSPTAKPSCTRCSPPRYLAEAGLSAASSACIR